MNTMHGKLKARALRESSTGKKIRTVLVHESGKVPVILAASGTIAEQVDLLDGKEVSVQANADRWIYLIASTDADGEMIVLDSSGLS